MTVLINYLAVFVAAIVAHVIGYLWYGPLWGKPWMKEMGMDPNNMKEMKGGSMAKLYIMSFIGSLVTAYVLAHILVYAGTFTNTSGMTAGLMVGFWSWLGFIAPVTLGSILWEKKTWKLWFINNGYYLIDLLVMGMILAIWM